ncbi:MAG: HAMP domain-containing histidine kinase [Parcubacteria group bacterium]|nr:HAMP domain-containing histidine kinase [Parcubacteria group bacterium]
MKSKDLTQGVLESVWHCLSDAFFVVDGEGEILGCNEEAMKMAKGKRISGKNVHDVMRFFVHTEERSFEQLLLLCRGKKSVCFEHLYVKSESENCSARAFIVRLASKGIKRYMLVLQKIFSEPCDHIRSEWLDIVATKLKMPLQNALWGLEAQREHEKQGVGELSSVSASVRGALRFLDQLKWVNALECGSSTAKKRPVDIVSVLRSLVNDFAPLARLAGVNLRIDVSKKIPLIKTDEMKLSAAMFEIIDNAIRYNRKSGHVLVNIFPRRDFLCIRVYDDGYGMTSQERSKVGVKFFRTRHGRKVFPDGSGLGMYLSMKLIALLGGKIRLTAIPSKGTTVYAYVPILNHTYE